MLFLELKKKQYKKVHFKKKKTREQLLWVKLTPFLIRSTLLVLIEKENLQFLYVKNDIKV